MKNFSAVAQVVVGLPVEGPFDYLIEPSQREQVAIGKRVQVSFGRATRVGYVVGLKQKSAYKELKPIMAVLDQNPVLDEIALQLIHDFSHYYGCTLGEAIEAYLPAVLRTLRRCEAVIPSYPKVKRSVFKPVLIYDLTLTERWKILAEHITQAVSAQKSIIFLVPEVHLIANTLLKLGQITKAFMVALDHHLSTTQELEQWVRIKKGEIPIVVGTRSAIFAPVKDPGLIVIYDEENPAYKQEQTPHYHVHRVAQMRCQAEGARCVFVSSSPRVETWELIRRCKGKKIQIDNKALAPVQIVDLSNYNPQRSSILSYPLQNSIPQILEQKGKVLLYLNRLGFSTFTRCMQCGHTLKCERCSINLTYRYSDKVMVCGRCAATVALPKVCPQCHQKYLKKMGTGIEKLESEVAHLYPYCRVRLFDKDSEDVDQIFDADIIIGTQALLRVKETKKVDLIGVINIDAETSHVDFRSSNRLFSLLIYFRQMATGKVLIQTRLQDQYYIKAAKLSRPQSYYRQELSIRRECGLPPFTPMVIIQLRSSNEKLLQEEAAALFLKLKEKAGDNLELSEPYQDETPKVRNKYRSNLVCKGKTPAAVLDHIKNTLKTFRRKKDLIITLNVDP